MSQVESGKTTQANSDSPLFRPEVMLSQSQQWLGAIRLAQPVSGWLVAGVALVVASALIAFITFGSVTKKARVTGVTVPVGGSITISAPNAGILVRSLVAEGQSVVAGQALFELSTERRGDQGEITTLISQQLAARQASMESEQRLRSSQAADKKEAIQLRLGNLVNELAQLEQEIVLTQRRNALAQESVAKFQTLQANGYVSGAQVQQKQEELIDIDTRLSNLRRNKLQVEATQLSLQAEQRDLTSRLATDQALLQRSLASLRQEIVENQNRKATLVSAAHAGTITTVTFQVGQAVSLGQALATLIPNASEKERGNEASSKNNTPAEAPLEVHLYAPSRTAGFVSPGQSVLIRYQAYPYQKFGLQKGSVVDISKTPFAPNELPPNLASTILSNAQQSILGFNSNEALYRVKVKLEQQTIQAYGQAQRLKPGMTLEADVQQDSRKIWEWVLEPVLAVARRQ
jgi:membrane fusion protein